MQLTNNKYEYVDGYRIIRNKNKPWICTTVNYWWEDLFFPTSWPKQFIDTKHQTWKDHMIKLANSSGAKFVKEHIRNNKSEYKKMA